MWRARDRCRVGDCALSGDTGLSLRESAVLGDRCFFWAIDARREVF